MQQRPRPAFADRRGFLSVKRATIAIIGLLAACRLLGRRPNPGSAVHVSRHGATPAPTLDTVAAAIMISQYRQNNGLGTVAGRSRPDLSWPSSSPRRWRPANKMDHDVKAPLDKRLGGLRLSRRRSPSRTSRPDTTHLAEAFSGWRGLAAAPRQTYAQRTVSQKLGIAASLCSKYQIQGVLDAHPCINLKQVRLRGFDASQGSKLGVILASISPIDAVGELPPRCRPHCPLIERSRWIIPTPRRQRTPAKAQRVLVLQGGGALGSYQAGAFQALCRSGFRTGMGRGHFDRRHQCRDHCRQWAGNARRSPQGILGDGVRLRCRGVR